MIITVALEDLHARLGHATTSDGTLLTAADVNRYPYRFIDRHQHPIINSRIIAHLQSWRRRRRGHPDTGTTIQT